MPAKYSHVKKRATPNPLKKASPNGHHGKEVHRSRNSNPHVDRSISQAMTAVSQLERAIARILLLRYEQDIARMFSTRLYSIALVHLPTFVMRCITLGGPGWPAYNADCDEIKDFFRAVISMDMRQAGERVATKSVLWSYTALRHFAMSNNVNICQKRGLHSLRLLPHYPALKAHLDVLESMPPPSFSKPPHLGSLQEGQEALEEACEMKYGRPEEKLFGPTDWEYDWRVKVQLGYEKITQTLWRVAREFDVRGYGVVLRDKLTTKWCDCGCSTDHLAEVCEKTVREDEEESGVRLGKQKEWDGRGSGVYGWETEEEEDIWEIELDFGGMYGDESEEAVDSDMTVGEVMEWRYFKAERKKEEGNAAFRKGNYEVAAKHYESAHDIESELPHYQLNLAAAHLKLNNWMEAEKACTKALSQHRSSKGYYRRARARKMMGRSEEAIRDLRAVLKLQPSNSEALAELISLRPKKSSISSSPSASSSSGAQAEPSSPHLHDRTGIGKPKPPKPLPFARTKADDRKLKMALLSTSLASVLPHSCDHLVEAFANSRGKEQIDKLSGKGGPGTRERLMEALRSESVSYPSWDRYVVKRVD